MKITALYTYPVKSLGGILLRSAILETRGFQYDRRWMLVDSGNRYLSQREIAKMSGIQVRIEPPFLVFTSIHDTVAPLQVPLSPSPSDHLTVKIFDDTCDAVATTGEADEWFSQVLDTSCRLVYMPDSSRRSADKTVTGYGGLTSFTDGFPFLLLSEESLEDLNLRLNEPVAMNRFRPNIVVQGGQPYGEDRLEAFNINDHRFFGVKGCGRCIITTINQETAEKGKEPLRTLAGYRTVGSKVIFGRYLVHQGVGRLHIGDEITVHSKTEVL